MKNKLQKEQKILEVMKMRVQRFIKENGREPSHLDFNECKYLPSARTIQRRFGGLRQFRKDMGLSVTDYAKGEERTKTAKKTYKRSLQYEKDIFEQLYKKHHDYLFFTKTVAREVPYQMYNPNASTWSNVRSDIMIDDRKNKTMYFFDLFWAENMLSYTGCIRSKRKKLQKYPITVPDKLNVVYTLVCVNPAITKEMIKKSKVTRGQFVLLSYEEFTKQWLS